MEIFTSLTDLGLCTSLLFRRVCASLYTLSFSSHTHCLPDGPPSDAKGSAQFQWLERDLASVDRSQTPWVVFTTHRPVFCSSKDEFSQHKLEEELLEPIFLKYKVDLVLTGHMHV